MAKAGKKSGKKSPQSVNAEELPEGVRLLPEYAEGKQAFADKVKENPHPTGDPRIAWYAGYYDARINKRLGHIFERHGFTHP